MSLTRDDRRRLAGWLVLHAVVGVVALTLASELTLRLVAKERRRPGSAFRRLELFRGHVNKGVDVALVGNSYLGRGVSATDLRRRLAAAGLRTAQYAQDGSGSPLWYLVTKNVVCRAPQPPRLLVLAVLEGELTEPTARASAEQFVPLRAAAAGPELEFMGIMLRRYWAERELTDAVLTLLRAAWPAYSLKTVLRDRVFGACTDWPAECLRNRAPDSGWPGYGAAKKAVIQQHMILKDEPAPFAVPAGPDTDTGPTAAEFRASLDSSFLPALQRLCAARGIRLACVRMKRNPDWVRANPAHQARIDRYMVRLRGYCVGQGALWLDFSNDPALDAGAFGRDHHLGSTGRDYLTRRLAEELAAALPASGTPMGEGPADDEPAADEPDEPAAAL